MPIPVGIRAQDDDAAFRGKPDSDEASPFCTSTDISETSPAPIILDDKAIGGIPRYGPPLLRSSR